MAEELYLELEDDQWPRDYIDHDRQIVRAIVVDGTGQFCFVRVRREDLFGLASYIETAGGGVEAGEDLQAAIRRELREELGAEVEVLCKLGVVSDYYNVIHRHNINHYFLCRVISFGPTNMTLDEVELYHLSAAKLSYEDAMAEYAACAAAPIGKLVAAREVPMLQKAHDWLQMP